MMRGFVEKATPEFVSGWVLDEANPDQPVRLALYDGDACLALVTADRYREDLANAYKTSGRHGFHVNFSKGLFPLPTHLISIFIEEPGRHLSGSPRLIQTAVADSEPEVVSDWLTGRLDALLRGARVPSDMDSTVAFLANALSAALVRQSELRERGGATASGEEELAQDLESLPAYLKDTLERISAVHKPIWIPVSTKPVLSIVLACQGRLGTAFECIASILKYRPPVAFEVILVDCSGQAEMVLAPFLIRGNLRYLRLPAGSTATISWAHGARIAKSDSFLLIDDTVRFQPDAIASLLDSLEMLSASAVVAPRVTTPDGRLAEAGGMLGPFGSRTPRGYGAAFDDPAFARLVETEDIAHCAMMMSRQAYRQSGGFSEDRDLGALGVPDMALRARRAGMRIYTQGAATVVVEGERKADHHASGNAARAFSRHFAEDIAALEAARRKRRPRALAIDSYWPDLKRDAASQVFVDHARLLEELGFAVEASAFGTMQGQTDPELLARKYGLEAYGTGHFTSPLAHIEARKDDLELVYVHRLAAAEHVIPTVRRLCPAAKIVFNIADLHFLRRERELQADGKEEAREDLAAIRKRELDAIAAADSVITHSEYEADYIRSLIPSANVHVVGWSFPVAIDPLPFEKRKGLAFVGGFLHKPNIDAVLYFAKEIFPAIRVKIPEIEFNVIGSHMPQEIKDLAGNGIRIIGFQKDLAQSLSQIRMTIAPLRYGAGIKGKVLMSLAAGVPCLMSPIAAEGLPLEDDLYPMVIGSPNEWVERIMTLNTNALEWRRVAQAGQDLVRRKYSQAVILEQLRLAITMPINPTVAGLPEHQEAQQNSLALALKTAPNIIPDGSELRAGEIMPQLLLEQAPLMTQVTVPREALESAVRLDAAIESAAADGSSQNQSSESPELTLPNRPAPIILETASAVIEDQPSTETYETTLIAPSADVSTAISDSAPVVTSKNTGSADQPSPPFLSGERVTAEVGDHE